MSDDEIKSFPLWQAAGYGSALIPIIPPDATINATSDVKEPGKVPGKKLRDGTWVGLKDWTKTILTDAGLAAAEKWGASVGLKTAHYPAADLDVNDDQLAKTIEEIAIRTLGDAPIRVRPGSPRRLLLYHGSGFRKRRVAFMGPDGKAHAVELLGEGNQCVVEGKHPKGGEYKWRNGHPCALKSDGLREITADNVNAFFGELSETLEMFGCTVIPHEGSSTAQPRKPFDAPGMAAPSPKHVLDALKCKANDFETHEGFVAALAAVKASLGPDREDYYPDVEQWAIEGWPQNTPDYVRGRWDSIKEASLGWSWFEGLARAGGYTGQAQEDFNTPVAPEYMPAPEKPPAKAPVLTTTPTVFGDPATVAMRQWIYDKHYIRRFLSTTIAPGGVGKSKMVIAECLAMTSGKNILGVPVQKPVRVIYWNLEDPLDELQRQFMAAMKFHGVTDEDIGGRLLTCSARDYRGLKIAVEDRGVVKLKDDVIVALREQIIDFGADVVIFDPFVSIHAVSENDNNKIDEVCKALSEVAERCRCAIELVHHSRKFSGSQTEASVDDGRGASAMLAAVRSARVLNVMSKDEAERADVDQRRAYFRVDNGKSNLAPPPDHSTWRRLISVQLGNGDPIPHAGDEVGVVVPWEWPAADGDVTPEEYQSILTTIEGSEWREKANAKAWVGNAIAEGLGIDLAEPRAREKVKGIIKKWEENGMLIKVDGQDKHRNSCTFIKAGERLKAAAREVKEASSGTAEKSETNSATHLNGETTRHAA